MLGKLTEKQIEGLLKRQVTGRLGCHAKGATYIVPINYIYRDPYIFAHSGGGRKIDMMRQSPKVCFQVDEIQSIFSWQSVIAWGMFEEIIDDDEKQRVMQSLIHSFMPLVTHPAGHPWHGITENEKKMGNTIETIIYKIALTKKTGKFETEV